MRTSGKAIGISLLILAVMMVGCTRKTAVTISNHSDLSRNISVTVPDGTSPVGAVGAGGRLTHTLVVKTEDLPAECSYSAGAGASQSFMVSEDTKSKLWFRITKAGKLMGPYTKDDVHVETRQTGEVKVVVPGGTVVE